MGRTPQVNLILLIALSSTAYGQDRSILRATPAASERGWNDPLMDGLPYKVFSQKADGAAAATLLRGVPPDYSEEGRQAKVQGTVWLRVVIDANGNVARVRVTRGLGFGLDDKAVEAVRQWKFRPAYKDAQPVAMMQNVEVNFHLL